MMQAYMAVKAQQDKKKEEDGSGLPKPKGRQNARIARLLEQRREQERLQREQEPDIPQLMDSSEEIELSQQSPEYLQRQSSVGIRDAETVSPDQFDRTDRSKTMPLEETGFVDLTQSQPLNSALAGLISVKPKGNSNAHTAKGSQVDNEFESMLDGLIGKNNFGSMDFLSGDKKPEKKANMDLGALTKQFTTKPVKHDQ